MSGSVVLKLMFEVILKKVRIACSHGFKLLLVIKFNVMAGRGHSDRKK